MTVHVVSVTCVQKEMGEQFCTCINMLSLCSRICQNHWSLWDFKTWFTVLFNAASVQNSSNISVSASLNTKLWERKAHFEAYSFKKYSHFLFLMYIKSLQNNDLLAFTNYTHVLVAYYVILCYFYGHSCI